MTSMSASVPKPTLTATESVVRRRGPASARFYVCVAILVVSAGGMRMLAEYLGARFRKEALDLKRPLAQLDWDKLAPEYRTHLIQAPPLSEEQTEQLGTPQYLHIRLVDTRRTRTERTAVANVFITYYTGQPDMVPHVPDECYLAGGFDAVGQPEVAELGVPGVGAPHDKLPVRIVEFQSREGRERPTVLYFFHCNGEYKTTRDGVRVRLARLGEKYAYYAKIEVNFTEDPVGGGRARGAEKAEALAAMGPLLRKLMPVLLADHLAWERVAAAAAGADRRAGRKG